MDAVLAVGYNSTLLVEADELGNDLLFPNFLWGASAGIGRIPALSSGCRTP